MPTRKIACEIQGLNNLFCITYLFQSFKVVCFIHRDEGRGLRDDGPGPRDRDGPSEEPWRRTGPPPDRRSEGPAEKGPWRPSGQGGWREREKEKHEAWKKNPDKE